MDIISCSETGEEACTPFPLVSYLLCTVPGAFHPGRRWYLSGLSRCRWGKPSNYPFVVQNGNFLSLSCYHFFSILKALYVNENNIFSTTRWYFLFLNTDSHRVAQAGLKTPDSPASTSWVLALQVYNITLGSLRL